MRRRAQAGPQDATHLPTRARVGDRGRGCNQLCVTGEQQLDQQRRATKGIGDHSPVAQGQRSVQLAVNVSHEHRLLERLGAVERREAQQRETVVRQSVPDRDRGQGRERRHLASLPAARPACGRGSAPELLLPSLRHQPLKRRIKHPHIR